MTCQRALARFTQTEPEVYAREELNKLLKVPDAEERLEFDFFLKAAAKRAKLDADGFFSTSLAQRSQRGRCGRVSIRGRSSSGSGIPTSKARCAI